MTTPRELALRLAAVTVIADAAKTAKDQIRADLADALDDLGADSAKAILPDGIDVAKATLIAPEAKATVTDERAFIEYVEANAPTEIIRKVRESYQKAILDRLSPLADGTAVDRETGEIIPGIRFTDRTAYVSIRFVTNGRDHMIEAIRSGAVPLDLTDTPTPALEQK